uniref:Uncharacterized protein n=1 Tax=Trichobilharzia regenti TaxID=157069 RepID=A0AA85KF04_TRIRE|nr:unnamed protein product [Trichobilharzia regenti]
MICLLPPVSLMSLKSYLVLPILEAFSISLAFVARHCSRSLRRLFVSFLLCSFRSSLNSELAGISLLASISSDEAVEIQWFLLTFGFTLFTAFTAVSMAAWIFFQASSG